MKLWLSGRPFVSLTSVKRRRTEWSSDIFASAVAAERVLVFHSVRSSSAVRKSFWFFKKVINAAVGL